MEPGRGPRWDLMKESLFQPAQSELKMSGLLQWGLLRDSSQGYMLKALGAGLREAGGMWGASEQICGSEPAQHQATAHSPIQPQPCTIQCSMPVGNKVTPCG